MKYRRVLHHFVNLLYTWFRIRLHHTPVIIIRETKKQKKLIKHNIYLKLQYLIQFFYVLGVGADFFYYRLRGGSGRQKCRPLLTSPLALVILINWHLYSRTYRVSWEWTGVYFINSEKLSPEVHLICTIFFQMLTCGSVFLARISSSCAYYIFFFFIFVLLSYYTSSCK